MERKKLAEVEDTDDINNSQHDSSSRSKLSDNSISVNCGKSDTDIPEETWTHSVCSDKQPTDNSSGRNPRQNRKSSCSCKCKEYDNKLTQRSSLSNTSYSSYGLRPKNKSVLPAKEKIFPEKCSSTPLSAAIRNGKLRSHALYKKKATLYEETVNNLCSEIDRMADALCSQVRKEFGLLERQQTKIFGENGNNFESCDELSEAQISTSRTDRWSRRNTSRTGTRTGCAPSCCCRRYQWEPQVEERSRQPVASILRPVDRFQVKSNGYGNHRLRHRFEQENFERTRRSNAAEIMRLRSEFDQDCTKMRQLWFHPNGDCIEADGGVFVHGARP